MLKLHGFPVSNYYNVVKAAMLEKGVGFEEVYFYPAGTAEERKSTPMGKVPYLETPEGTFAESQVMLEYLEEVYPANPLYPRDPFQRAKVRELLRVMELYIELQARRLYPEAFFGQTVTDQTKQEVKPVLDKGLEAFRTLAKFSPYVAGESFTLADVVTVINLPLARNAYRRIYGEDLFPRLPGIGEYLKWMGERPSFQRVNEDQQKGMEAFRARSRA